MICIYCMKIHYTCQVVFLHFSHSNDMREGAQSKQTEAMISKQQAEGMPAQPGLMG